MASEDPERRDPLIQALQRAVVAEEAEIKRLDIRLSAGYGDDWTRATMRQSLADAQARRQALLDLLAERSVTPD
jgi:hypothetical protein